MKSVPFVDLAKATTAWVKSAHIRTAELTRHTYAVLLCVQCLRVYYTAHHSSTCHLADL
jgi:hypothetical protein